MNEKVKSCEETYQRGRNMNRRHAIMLSLFLKERKKLMPCEKNIKNGFTLIEVIIVIVILSITALTAIPMFSSGANMQIRSAANMIAADLEYARSMAISRGQNYSIEFNKDTESYCIKKTGDSDPIDHPVKKGFPYSFNFTNDSRLSKVVIDSTTNLSSDTIIFDSIGSPVGLTNEGIISLSAGINTTRIRIQPVTGFITIQ
jgi:prepilin-type N-terminal cleavage/methylation domain-containing protein